MPASPKGPEETSSVFDEIAQAWTALENANEALLAANATGSRHLSRECMPILQNRAAKFLRAVEALIEETTEE